MAKQEYSPGELTKKILDILLKDITHQWENALNFSKDIREQTLRKFMQNLVVKEVKEALKNIEQNLIPRFNAFLIMSKDIEAMVQ